uniref:Photosystem I reaction center subunit VI n=1 Tax=Populus trichocarpa TaxID=3694 RepID=Q0ZCE1_POPTR|nr:photosystem I reaction center subunit VI [Populus trichocarpa]
MASLATFAAVQPATIKGLGGSSLSGTKLHVKPSRQGLRPKSLRTSGVNVIISLKESVESGQLDRNNPLSFTRSSMLVAYLALRKHLAHSLLTEEDS